MSFERMITINEQTSRESSSDGNGEEVSSRRIFEEASSSRIFEIRNNEEASSKKSLKEQP